jgi:predicted metal-binding membrane protein
MVYKGSLKRDRTVLLGAMIVLAALAWAYTLHLAGQHASMAGAMTMPAMMQWSPTDIVFMLVMWAVMMFAMMLPSVTPTVMIFGRVREKREAAGRPFARTGAFVAGYLLAWVGFSLLATAANWWLHTHGSMSSMMGKVAPLTGGVLLIAAGTYQWTPLKKACLEHCRSPMSFLMQHWREGTSGAILMGLHHGAYCLGCCWLLMVLLFVLGVMNLPWVAVLSIVVLAEKTLPFGETLSRGAGVLLIAWGAWLVAAG